MADPKDADATKGNGHDPSLPITDIDPQDDSNDLGQDRGDQTNGGKKQDDKWFTFYHSPSTEYLS